MTNWAEAILSGFGRPSSTHVVVALVLQGRRGLAVFLLFLEKQFVIPLV